MYIVCHMVESVDGRIDCDVMEKIDDTDHYYETLNALQCDATIEGKTTLVMHYAEPGVYVPKGPVVPAGRQVYKAKPSDTWAVGVDTRGTLLWGEEVEQKFERPLIMILSERASSEYLDYLKTKGISYITIGEDRVELRAAMEVLSQEFGIQRLAVVGGGHLNGSFLDQGLLDEISILYASGIDAREGMASSFDGRASHKEPIRLNLTHVEQLDDLIWARYTVKEVEMQ